MGANYSLNNLWGDSTTNYLYNNIQKEVLLLINNYEIWTDMNTCGKIRRIYNDQLLQFNLDNLNSVYLAIENQEPTDMPKEELCRKIIDHYLIRIEVLKVIYDEVNKWHKRLRTVNAKTLCKGTRIPRYNYTDCVRAFGTWMGENEIIDLEKNLVKLGKYDIWKNHFDKMNYTWFKNLRILNKIIEIIRELNNNLNTESIMEIRSYTNNILEKMNRILEIYVLLISNYS